MSSNFPTELIENDIEEIGSLSAVARKRRVNKGVVWRVLNGGNSPAVNRAYGIPEPVTIDPCECGEVHCKKTHPQPRDKGRHRRAGEFSGERVAQYDAMLAAWGISTTELLNTVLDKWLDDGTKPGGLNDGNNT